MWRHIKPVLQSSYSGPPCWFPFLHSLKLENTTKSLKTFHLVHIIIPNCNWVTRILAHPLKLKFKILLWSKSKIIVCFFIFLHTALYKKRNQGAGINYAHTSVYHVVQTFYRPIKQRKTNIKYWFLLTKTRGYNTHMSLSKASFIVLILNLQSVAVTNYGS